MGGNSFFLSFASVATTEIQRDKNGKIARNEHIVKSFKLHNPCPATGKIQVTCPGYIVDHILPLCAYGDDIEDNLQWQTKVESLKKDKLENKQCKDIKSVINKCGIKK